MHRTLTLGVRKLLDATRREAQAWREEPMKRVALRARILRPYRRRQFAAFGEHSLLHRPDWIYGAHRIAIGARVMILHHAWVSVERSAWSRPEPALVIGDGVVMRPGVTVSASDSIVIEDNVVIGAYSTVLDSDHSHAGDSEHVLWNPGLVTPVRIGRGTWLGDRVAVLRGSNIGHFCIIGANSVVRGDIPDFSIPTWASSTSSSVATSWFI